MPCSYLFASLPFQNKEHTLYAFRISSAQPAIHHPQYWTEGLLGVHDHSTPLLLQQEFFCRQKSLDLCGNRALEVFIILAHMLWFTALNKLRHQDPGTSLSWHQRDSKLLYFLSSTHTMLLTWSTYQINFHFSVFPCKKNIRMSLGELHSTNKPPYSTFSVTSAISLYQNSDMLGEAHICKSQESLQAHH